MNLHDQPDEQELRESRWTAYALGQLEGAEREAVERELRDNADIRRFVEEIRALGEHVKAARAAEPLSDASSGLRKWIIKEVLEDARADEEPIVACRSAKVACDGETRDNRVSDVDSVAPSSKETAMIEKNDSSAIQQVERRRRRWSLVATAACSFLAGSIFVALALPALDRQFALRGHAEPTRIGQADRASTIVEPKPSPGEAEPTETSETVSTEKATATGSTPAPADPYGAFQVYPTTLPPVTGDATALGPYQPDITIHRSAETGQFGIGVESDAGLMGSIVVDEQAFPGKTQGVRTQKMSHYGGSPYPALSDESRGTSMATGMSAPGPSSAGAEAGLGVGHGGMSSQEEKKQGVIIRYGPPDRESIPLDTNPSPFVDSLAWSELTARRRNLPSTIDFSKKDETAARQGSLLNNLNSVESSNIVFNDNEPIMYPAPEAWTTNPQMGLAGAYSEAQLRASRSDRESWSLSQVPGTEQYAAIVENLFLTPFDSPLSTFSIDVDTASYANVRRFLDGGQLPPPDAVRVEEMVNYFDYDYPTPEGDEPFSVHFELADCPWRQAHRLLLVGLKGREMARGEQGPSNLVFLLDVSGSMADENKLPLVKKAMRLLVDRLTEDDRVAIVTYASGTEVRLESTNGQNKEAILAAIDSLRAGGSTNGSGGIQLAYQQAAKHFLAEGNNRVILATDGDLNVGITDDDELARLIAEKAKSGVFLSVLGFGTGNLQDAQLEKLANRGNGHYAYIDNLREARKVLIEEMTGSLFAIAKDVKIQIEFNPARVAAYRLIGYENRVLAARDFDDDKKDAGEIGAGHTVTALYEIVPVRDPRTEWKADQRVEDEPGASLKYQKVVRPAAALSEAADSNELATVRLRYKRPDGEKSQLLEEIAPAESKSFSAASPDFQFASAVASFAMLLRGSRFAGDATLAAIEEYAAPGLANDAAGHRAGFVDLVRKARELMPVEKNRGERR